MLPESQRALLDIAREAVRVAATSKKRYTPPAPGSPELLEPRAVFVTLHANGELRGCIGSTAARLPLYRAVADAAFNATLDDPRFPSLTAKELPGVSLEVSVLSPFEDIRAADVVAGKHGLMISEGSLRGLLLPQVAGEYGWNAEQLLAATCRKAGLPRDAWRKGARIQAFTAEIFGE